MGRWPRSPPEGDEYSIQYGWMPLEFSYSSSVEIASARAMQVDEQSNGRCNERNGTESSSGKIVTTPEFVSAAVGFWKAVSRPLNPSHSRARARGPGAFQRESSVVYRGGEVAAGDSSSLVDSDFYLHDRKSVGCFSSASESGYEHLKALKGMMFFQPSTGFSSEFPEGHRDYYSELHKRAASKLMAAAASGGVHHPLATVSEKIDPRGSDGNFDHCRDFMKGDKESTVQRSNASPYGAFLAPQVSSSLEHINVSSCMDFSLSSDYRTGFPTSICCTLKEHQLSPGPCQMVLKSSEESYLLEEDAQDKDRNVCNSHGCDGKYPPIVQGSMWDKIAGSFAKGRHALAGGLAGIFVSICLHPVDTVKSIIQVHGKNQEPLLQTIKRITSERGVMGLYRGIPSSMASSAPISAVYTFTYESVKGAFLPPLPKEYHSFAHCGAGGCVAALIGVVQKGGLPSLYTGWGAVLFRNVPHSVIKFYTYERLKQLLHPSTEPDADLSTFTTLVCGGLAGSSAALFTTPFDVVKTKLQAQMPGSQGKYNGVLNLLKEISRREGIRGLYRGLTPRLFMYVSQGAIFFGSYEFLKRLFSFQGEHHRVRAEPCHADNGPRS
ncbi:unnamed protein product [Spirodela intermedia]|uniref:Uncharacterized protein n=1 Tax=Spirodela intermedia TaxID=51605 RepID=A0A7I8L1B4_SPIIN|nr:unnamed protein product [Spirodela intermedia]